MNKYEIKRPRDVDIMSASKLFFVLLIPFVFAAPIFASEDIRVNGENVVTSTIDKAEESMASAYEAVLEAKRARADVSGLLHQLNNASKYLAKAHMLYKLGDFNGAVDSADLSYEIGMKVRNSAEELKIKAYESWIAGLWIRIIGSIVGIIAVVFGTFTAWRAFKRRYFQQA